MRWRARRSTTVSEQLGGGLGSNRGIPTASRNDYKLLAARRLSTLQREMSAAGADGFRVVAVPDHPNEGVLLLERASATANRIEYALVTLSEETAGQALAGGEGDGYSVVVLVDNGAVLMRALGSS